MKAFRFLLLALWLSLAALAQVSPNGPKGTAALFLGVPSGSCNANQLAVNTLTGDLYSCKAGTWIGASAGTLSASFIGASGPLPADPICITGTQTNPTIASCITYLNTLGVTNNGIIYSMTPEEFTTQPFAKIGSGPFSGRIFLTNALTGTSVCGTTPNAAGVWNCYTTEVPLIIPTHLEIIGLGGTGAPTNMGQGTVITSGASHPAPLGAPAALASVTCANAPGTGTLSNGNYYVQMALVRNAMGGNTAPQTPLFGAPLAAEGTVTCNAGTATQQITVNSGSLPASGAGFAAREVAIFSSCNTSTGAISGTCTTGGNNSGSGLEIENAVGTDLTCPGAAGTIDTNACALGAGGAQTFIITGSGGLPSQGDMTAPFMDISNPIIVMQRGQTTIYQESSQLKELSIQCNNDGTNNISNAAVGFYNGVAQEVSGLDNVSFFGGCPVFIYSRANDSHYTGINIGSTAGPVAGVHYDMICDGRGKALCTREIRDSSFNGRASNQLSTTTGNVVGNGVTATVTAVSPATWGSAYINGAVTTVSGCTGYNGAQTITNSPVGTATLTFASATNTTVNGCTFTVPSIETVPANILIMGGCQASGGAPCNNNGPIELAAIHLEGKAGDGIQVTNGASVIIDRVDGFVTGAGGGLVHFTSTSAGGCVFGLNRTNGTNRGTVQDDLANPAAATVMNLNSPLPVLGGYCTNMWYGTGYNIEGFQHLPANTVTQPAGAQNPVTAGACCTTWKTFLIPQISIAQQLAFSCSLPTTYVSGGTATLTLGVQVPTGTYTSIEAEAQIFSNLTGTSTTTGLPATTSGTGWLTVLTGAAPAGNGTFPANLHGIIEIPALANPIGPGQGLVTLNIGDTDTNATSVSIARGAQCVIN